jgi:hypothetical protein
VAIAAISDGAGLRIILDTEERLPNFQMAGWLDAISKPGAATGSELCPVGAFIHSKVNEAIAAVSHAEGWEGSVDFLDLSGNFASRLLDGCTISAKGPLPKYSR